MRKHFTRRSNDRRISCKHFTRRSNDRRISCLRDSADISPPGQLARLARSILGLVLCRNKHKRAMTARFHNVAKGNISRLRDAQAFHAAVKRPPYFMFARQRGHFTAGAACPACAVYFLGSVLCCNKYKRALTARFLSVAKGNISRLRDAQAFHAAVKLLPYFMFARQRRHFTAGAACPACAV